MGVAPVLALSLLLQFTAALLSLHMVRVTGRRSAWLLIALAIALCHTQRSSQIAFAGKGQRKPEVEALLSRMVRR